MHFSSLTLLIVAHPLIATALRGSEKPSRQSRAARRTFGGLIGPPNKTTGVLTERAPGTGTTKIDLSPAYVTVTLEVGEPPQQQTLTFDTGSGLFWVYYGTEHGLFNPALSTSFRNQSAPFVAGVGNAIGYWAQDTIQVGTISLKSAWVGMAANVISQAGAMGFAPPASDPHAYGTPPSGTQEPFTATLARSLAKPIAGVNMFSNQPGPITFGYLDDTQYAGNISWIDIDTSSAAWWVDKVFFSFNGVGTQSSAGQRVVLDTGGQRISFDSAIVQEYYSKIPGAIDISPNNAMVYYDVPCGSTMPDLDLGFNDDQWTPKAKIMGAYLINQDDRNGLCSTNFGAGPNNFGPPFWMSNYVALNFDQKAPMAGFAAKVLPKASAETPDKGTSADAGP